MPFHEMKNYFENLSNYRHSGRLHASIECFFGAVALLCRYPLRLSSLCAEELNFLSEQSDGSWRCFAEACFIHHQSRQWLWAIINQAWELRSNQPLNQLVKKECWILPSVKVDGFRSVFIFQPFLGFVRVTHSVHFSSYFTPNSSDTPYMSILRFRKILCLNIA